MSPRRSYRQAYRLDSGDVDHLSREEVALALRAAEDLITSGGRTLLVKILRGSKAKDIRPEHRENPAYGAWEKFSQVEVSHRVDWCIEQGFLDLQYYGKFPLLVYPPKGLAIECQAIASECYQRAVAEGLQFLLERISDVPLPTLLALLDRVAEGGKERGLSILEAWKPLATKRIRKRIRAIMGEWHGTGYRMRYVFDTAWFDESLSFLMAGQFRGYAKTKSILAGEWKYISKEHSGMPDVDIYTSLLKDKRACLVTSDRSFHNALCQVKISSFYFDPDSEKFSAAPLPGVKPRGIFAL